ncbi:NADP-reducing hydrogenase subunit HndD [Desulfitispora alkaliphila]|uniref:NADH-dependent [FeFe] hydrogenase, group A6 n=1 Tax=Desulfitispora alkaliphila TaxID=622674 RepID=UPI003D1C38C8
MKKINLTIDGHSVTVPADFTVLQAARELKINIPTLCFLKEINEIGACRMCLVEVKGARSLQASCMLPVSEGMEVKTNTAHLRKTRRTLLELILSNHNRECTTCHRNSNCELQVLAEELGIREIRYPGESPQFETDELSPSIVRDPSKCILCRRCVAVCHKVQQVGVIQATERGFDTKVEPAFNLSLDQVPCINCGQCIQACPVAALREKDDTDKVWEALDNPDLHVVVQTAPAVRVALGEEFGLPSGTIVTGKMVTALKNLGFAKVFDTDFAADLTIMEEGHELLGRLEAGGNLPLITSCSPGWVKFLEHYYPDFIDNLSTCKSPQQMMGAILKSYYAKQAGVDPEKVYVVSVMPCIAKKFEANRPELNHDGLKDVDAVISTRELAQMIKQAGLKFNRLPDSEYDNPLGESTGAAVIFGTTGGVMEAALRTVVEVVTGKKQEEIEYEAVRGLEGVKEVALPVGDITVKAAIVHGTGNARKLLEKIKAGEAQYHFVEVMACPGGCVNGGGQPIRTAVEKDATDFRAVRAEGIYKDDKQSKLRKSHQNPAVQKLYKEYLDKPNSELAHKLLHTHYTKREQ